MTTTRQVGANRLNALNSTGPRTPAGKAAVAYGTDRFPRIVETALRNRNSSFVLDGEAVLLDATGISDFSGLHSRRRDTEVQLYAFDILAADGDDLRKLPLSLRKTNLARILARRID